MKLRLSSEGGPGGQGMGLAAEAVVGVLRSRGPLSREELAALTGWSAPTVRRAIEYMRGAEDACGAVRFRRWRPDPDNLANRVDYHLQRPAGTPVAVTLAQLVEAGICSPELAHILACRILGCQEDQP